MPTNVNNPPDMWRNWSTKVPLRAYRLKRTDLKRLYKMLYDKQIEVRDRVLGGVVQLDGETAQQFEQRKRLIFDAFVISMSVAGSNDESSHGNNEAFLDDTNLPYQLKSVLFSNVTVPNAVLGVAPPCRVTLFLDLRRLPIFDLSRLPSLPTFNESNFEIQSDEENWFTAINTRLTDFFREKRTNVNWLHAAGMYDALLFFVGIPLAIWSTFIAGPFVGRLEAKCGILTTAVYIYVFMISLMLFRVLFSYARALFPKAEIETDRSWPRIHRGVLATLVVGIIGKAVYDLLRTLLFN